MKKKKYDRPFVEVLTLETSRGMMAGSPGGGNGGRQSILTVQEKAIRQIHAA